jgi:CheY-like chemotaxis protein
VASQVAFAIERQRAVQELKRAHDDILAASRAKDSFLATLSHELRTPLNPVLLIASDAMSNPKLTPEVRADFEMILKNVELEARLIDDLLDLTRITRGKIILDKHPIEIHPILKDAVAHVQEEVRQKQISLTLKLNAVQQTVFADAVRLQQIFWNLLKNAVKFTPPKGRITVETAALKKNRIAIKVTDSGIGLSAEELSRIFNAFSQGDHAHGGNSHRFGGLGLGLAISQKLAEFHSGAIRATSQGRDKGASFIVELPLAERIEQNGKEHPTGSAELSPVAAPSMAGLRILLVEDHEPTRTALAQLLTRRTYDVMTAATIAEALHLAGTQTFNLLISDIGLPDGSGYDLMAELRQRGSLRGIALTGYGMEQDLARSHEAGFVAHLTKPVRVQFLEAALNAAAQLIREQDRNGK